MLRLSHRILSQQTIPNSPGLYDHGDWKDGGQQTAETVFSTAKELLSRPCPIIIADNVKQYLNEEYRNGKGRLGPEDFPPMPPPFDSFFVEWLMPSVSYYGGRPQTNSELGYSQAGAFLLVFSNPDWIRNDEHLKETYQRKELSQAGWYLFCEHFVTIHGTALPAASIEFLLDSSGRLMSARGKHRLTPVGDGRLSYGASGVLFMTMAFMACKNVARLDATRTEAPPPKWCRRQRVPELKYHVLQIDPNLGATSRSGERKTEGDCSGKALHICRGHFAHYVDDGVSQGLFGRRQFGTFWVPAHTRGSLEHGQVVSTYNVKAPVSAS